MLNSVPGEEPRPEPRGEVRHEEEAVDDVLRLAPLPHLVAASCRSIFLICGLNRNRRSRYFQHCSAAGGLFPAAAISLGVVVLIPLPRRPQLVLQEGPRRHRPAPVGARGRRRVGLLVSVGLGGNSIEKFLA